jgi:hypothetical protein
MGKPSNRLHFCKGAMNRVLLLFLAIVAMAFGGGCAPDPVAQDVEAYLRRDVPAIGELEREFNREFDGFTQMYSRNPGAALGSLTNSLRPNCVKILERLNSEMRPQTTALLEVHELYVASFKAQDEALALFEKAIQTGDSGLFAEANSKIAAVNSLKSRWHFRLQEMIDHHKVTP